MQPHTLHCFFRNLCLLSLLILPFHRVEAGSATWNLDGPSGNWNQAANWTPQTIPNSPNDTATFTYVFNEPSIFSDVEINSIVFSTDGGDVTITTGDPSGGSVATLTISGSGIVNNAVPSIQTIQAAPTLATNEAVNTILLSNSATLTTTPPSATTNLLAEGATSAGFVGGQVQFLDSASGGQAGELAGVIAHGGANGGGGGTVFFSNSSSAGYLEIYNSGAADASSSPGTVIFEDSASAGNAGVGDGLGSGGGAGSNTFFFDSSTADDATVAATGGADGTSSTVVFSDTATAGNAFLFGFGTSEDEAPGIFQFIGDSTGGTATVELEGIVALDISSHNPPGITIGSLEGTHSSVTLGANNLTIGSNNLDSTFAGTISGTGSVTKIGTGGLELTGNNLYTGPTTVSGGLLRVSSTRGGGSATGAGAVTVTGGSLAGRGMIAGPVTIGRNGFLAPSAGGSAGQNNRHLTIQNSLALLTGSTYTCQFKLANPPTADQVWASGITIAGGAHFGTVTIGSAALPVGTTFLIINNTSGHAISGTFVNLADGAVINVNGNNLQANYEGGDGNDLTLTVVP